MLQRTNPVGTISVTINATEIFEKNDDDEFLDDVVVPNIEITSMSISQSVDAPLSNTDSTSLSGSIDARNGRGSGQVAVSLRHIVSAKTWVELQLAAGQGPVMALKGFRTLSKSCFMTANTMLHFSPAGIRPAVDIGKNMHLNC